MAELTDKEKEIFGNKVRKIRNDLGLNQEDFGKKFKSNDNPDDRTGIANKAVVSAWERGVSVPSNERLKIIADIGGVSVNELLYGSIEEYATYLINEVREENKYSYDEDISDVIVDFFVKGNTYPTKEDVESIYQSQIIMKSVKGELSDVSKEKINNQKKTIAKNIRFVRLYNGFKDDYEGFIERLNFFDSESHITVDDIKELESGERLPSNQELIKLSTISPIDVTGERTLEFNRERYKTFDESDSETMDNWLTLLERNCLVGIASIEQVNNLFPLYKEGKIKTSKDLIEYLMSFRNNLVHHIQQVDDDNYILDISMGINDYNDSIRAVEACSVVNKDKEQ